MARQVRARAAAEVDRVRVAADSDAEHFKEFTVMQVRGGACVCGGTG